MKTNITACTLAPGLWLLAAPSAPAFFDSHIGRWASRDPAEESGSVSLPALLNNDAVNHFDRLGLVVGKVSVRHWRPTVVDRFLSHKRGWLTELVWRPPTEWGSLKCPPCSMVIWTQDAATGREELKRDWGEEDYADYTVAWVAGKRGSDEARLFDEPSIEGPFVFAFPSPYRFRARSYVKCILGRDFGQTYHTVDWGFTWEYDHAPRGTGPIYVSMDLADGG
jgi:hypothetical protein